MCAEAEQVLLGVVREEPATVERNAEVDNTNMQLGETTGEGAVSDTTEPEVTNSDNGRLAPTGLDSNDSGANE